MKKAEAPLTSPRIPELLTRLRKQYTDGEINVQDGLRVDWPDRWFHVRVSQTEPILRVICEQKGEPPAALFESVMEQVRELA
jgi:phosphomannomutase